MLSIRYKTIVQIKDTACLQIGGLCWYPSEFTLEITFEIILPLLLGYFCYLWFIVGVMGNYLLCL